MANFYSFLGGTVIYNLFDDGVANVLGLETLRHGTNPLNYLSIRILGGDPSHGGKPTGSTEGWAKDENILEGHFYLFKDSEYSTDTSNDPLLAKLILLPLIIKESGYRMLSRMHAFLSSYNFTARLLSSDSSSLIIKCFRVCVGLVGGLVGLCITPSLRFRFAEIDSTRLKNDPRYCGEAYRTTQKVEAWRIGLLGSIVTGVNLGWFSRARAHPLKVLTGAAQLTGTIALTALCIPVIAANPYLALPAAVGALLA